VRGHVRRRGKSWSFVLDVERDPQTKWRRQKWVSGFETKKAAEAGLRCALGRMDANKDPVPEKVTLTAYVETQWLPHLDAVGKPRERTRAGYAAHLRRYVLPLMGGIELSKIRVQHCQKVLDEVVDRAPGSVRHVKAAMSSCFQDAVRGELIATNPARATRTATPPKAKLTTPSPEQVRTLVDAAAGTVWEIPTLVCAATGARMSEVLGLRWRDVDLDRGCVKVVETLVRHLDGSLGFAPPKTRAAVREIPLPKRAVVRLRAYKIEQAQRRLRLGDGWRDLDLVCERGDGKPSDPSSFSHAFARIADQVGLGDVRLHDLRHSYATQMARAGTPAFVTAAILGHSSPAFTQATYQHADHGMLEAAARSVQEAFGH
jgi:integrase